jgi:hypothetical protein
MRIAPRILAVALICGPATPLRAVEGSSLAGPIGGTDIRSALHPPPGFYGGLIGLGAVGTDFVDGNGQKIPALQDARLTGKIAAPFLYYVPDIQLLGGSVAIAGVVPYGAECGRLIATTPKRCQMGFGDLYVEASWSRTFGTPRASQFPGAFPILEGLTIAVAFGVILPIGQYDAMESNTQGLSMGNNLYDFAPSFAFTYTTPPMIAEGTEFSAKLYWNNYLTNPATHYSTGSLLNLDFAISEHIGRFQVGLAGVYVAQVADDKQFGVVLPPDGRRTQVLSLGAVVAYDMPEHFASVKIKAMTNATAANTAKSQGVVLSLFKKLH